MVAIDLLKLDLFKKNKNKELKLFENKIFDNPVFESMHKNTWVRHVGFKNGPPKVAMQGIVCIGVLIWDTNNGESRGDYCGSRWCKCPFPRKPLYFFLEVSPRSSLCLWIGLQI